MPAMSCCAPGLSPRVRGNQPVADADRIYEGSIPACAGEPQSGHRMGGEDRVYPRVCGGTARRRPVNGAIFGLSPRVRGSQSGLWHRGAARRSIPACAGEPRSKASRPSPTRVYPRVCGGTITVVNATRRSAGLSPRVRGNRDRLPRWGRPGSSIPACAGEPRTSDASATKGLSPRVRGNLDIISVPSVSVRSIPACAGEPTAPALPPAPSWVYPRVCGGTRASVSSCSIASGLSPRVRGNRSTGWTMTPLVRSIPACAGEPSPARPVGAC